MNDLTESEWRTIHNALAVYQCGFRHFSERDKVQQLMNKVRDKYIAPYVLPIGQTCNAH